MKFAEFKKAGHWPTLLAAFLYFDISFMAWVALGPLIVYIARDMNLAVDDYIPHNINYLRNVLGVRLPPLG
jgi:NNP family nitrate/nitrite transporter-like MFS transporter